MSDDIFELWDSDQDTIRPILEKIPGSEIAVIDGRLWVLNKCILLHEDGQDE